MLVKKYGNRRLYDTEQSRYVRLDEIAVYGKQATGEKYLINPNTI